MGFLSAMPIIIKIKALEVRDLYEKKYVFFLKYHLLYQDKFLAHLLCHATYVAFFNKCSDPGSKIADL